MVFHEYNIVVKSLQAHASTDTADSLFAVTASSFIAPMKRTVNPMSQVNVPRANGRAFTKHVARPGSVRGYMYWPASCGMHQTPRLLIRKNAAAASSPVPEAATMCFGWINRPSAKMAT